MNEDDYPDYHGEDSPGDDGMLDDEALVTALRELLGPKNEAEQHGRRLAMIGENVRLRGENARLVVERDRAVRMGDGVATAAYEVATAAYEVVAELGAERDRTVEAIRAALHELGVPGEGYPAPVANAVEILRAALAGGSE